MGCRIGMATNVPARFEQLRAAGVIPFHARYRVLNSGLTYEEANVIETSERAACGSHCQGQSGGGYVSGRVWSVYLIEW